MLSHINISNFAIVESLDLDIPNKLCVITGETGAGKSIMIDALGLALGNRADSGSVRHGANKADILASFDIETNQAAQDWLSQHDLDEDGECILRRVINKDGRSRSYINGRPTPMSSLKALGEMLISIHGQHEHQALLKKDTHRQLLDQFSGLNTQVKHVTDTYNQWQQQQKAYEKIRDNAKELNDRVDLLRFQLGELEALDLQLNEFTQLEKEHKRLSNSEGLIDQGHQALQVLSVGENTALDTVANIIQLVTEMQQQDESLSETTELIASAEIQLQEAASNLQYYVESLDIDPERYQWIDQRIASAHLLARKHHITPNQLPNLQQTLAEELASIEGGDERIEQLQAQATASQTAFLEKAKNLSKKRQQQSKKLSKIITKQIQTLGMPGAVVAVIVDPLPLEQANANGTDSVEFHVQTNPGQPSKPLHKVASGGELSRISLSIQVACAAKSNVATLIFDEVDVGIGGAVAQVVGELLRHLGNENQVICVTHLPQVAAQGHHHLHVNKQTSKDSTHTGISSLSQDEKITEIARMLGGLSITEQTLAHAKELISESQC
ncbi:DNA repair protein RecN [Gammaproteobacteria bacterium 42_54_T18]|nr:DNA repair protein RecN [Gammaproteobacteria bacterium 42_54_T18]